MPKRKRDRKTKLDHLPWLAGIGAIGYFTLQPKYGTGVVILLGVVALLWWFLFLMPTKCDFEVGGRGCRRNVYGKVRGCHDHDRDKRDAIFAALQMRNPGLAFRVLWRDGSNPGHALGGSVPAGRLDPGDSAANRSQAMFNTLSIIVAMIGSVAGVLALL